MNSCRTIVIGCGAVSESFHVPACYSIPEVEVVAVADLDSNRAARLAGKYSIKAYSADYRPYLDKVDFAIVATPPSTHVPIAIDCLEAGVNVLVEKPMATSTAGANDLLAAARRSGAHLAVGMVRRLYPSHGLAKKLVDSRLFGNVVRFNLEEGGEFKWPAKAFSTFFDSAVAGGGVLADLGCHVFDTLTWLFDSPLSVLRYEDDNVKGVEADCRVEVEVKTKGRSVEGVIELSRIRRLRNRLGLEFENGFANLSTVSASEGVEVKSEYLGPSPVLFQNGESFPKTKLDVFVLQLKRFLDSVHTGKVEYVPGADCVDAVKLIENCYANRERMVHRWEE